MWKAQQVSSDDDEVVVGVGVGGCEMIELEKSRLVAKIWVHAAIVAAWCGFLAVGLWYLIEVFS